MKIILKTLVGSRAHGIHDIDSDYDYRGIFIQSTCEILSLNNKMRTTNWIEGMEDNTSYELSHFLSLACKSNPSVLEVLVSPVIEETDEGKQIRELFPYIWNSKDVLNSFGGYSFNQKKKFIEDKDSRYKKFAIASLRVAKLGVELLTTGLMTVLIKDECFRNTLLDIKNNKLSRGAILGLIEQMDMELQKAFDHNPNKETNYDKVNDYLLKVRKNNWIIEEKL